MLKLNMFTFLDLFKILLHFLPHIICFLLHRNSLHDVWLVLAAFNCLQKTRVIAKQRILMSLVPFPFLLLFFFTALFLFEFKFASELIHRLSDCAIFDQAALFAHYY
jgi:hypothetical protein